MKTRSGLLFDLGQALTRALECDPPDQRAVWHVLLALHNLVRRDYLISVNQDPETVPQ